jgi:hypothetical protein
VTGNYVRKACHWRHLTLARYGLALSAVTPAFKFAPLLVDRKGNKRASMDLWETLAGF